MYAPFLLLSFSLIADRLTKWWALEVLSEKPISVFYGFDLVIQWNQGVSWSMFRATSTTGYWLLTIFISCMILGLAAYIYHRAAQRYSIVFEMLVLGGALSNLIDRLYYGAVLDFIELYVGSYHWPVFNIADMCICFGVVGILIKNLWGLDEHKI